MKIQFFPQKIVTVLIPSRHTYYYTCNESINCNAFLEKCIQAHPTRTHTIKKKDKTHFSGGSNSILERDNVDSGIHGFDSSSPCNNERFRATATVIAALNS